MPQDTALHRAAKDGDIEGCLEAIQAGVGINAPGAQGRTALHRALGGGFAECAQKLIDNGADPLIPDAMKRTSLHWAVMGMGELDKIMACIELLFECQVVSQMVNAQSKSLSTPLHCAITAGKEEVAAVLLSRGGADPNLCDEDDKTCKMLAKEAGMKSLFEDSSVHGGKKRGGFFSSGRRRGSSKKDEVNL